MAAAVALLSPAAAGARAHAPGTVAVGYATRAALRALVERTHARVVRELPQLRAAELAPRGPAAAFARAAARSRGIRYAEPALPRLAAAEPALAPSLAGTPDFEWQFAATHEDTVPDAVARGAAAITIAVVDTGADLTAPDLAAKAPLTYNAVTGGTDVTDRSGHGTFVASLAAGSVTNGDGIAGFGGDARLLVVDASRSGETFTDVDEANAITWAVDHGARIVNLSFGGSTTSRTERDAVDYAVAHGALLVAAAGNEAQRGNPVEYPAALLQPVSSKGVGGVGLSVGASTSTGTRAPFSNTGGYISLAAPGVDVLGAVASTSSGGDYPRLSLTGATGGLYGLGSGTSYATPEVAGAAALVWAANPALTAQAVAAILKQTASNGGTWNPETGWGVINVAAAVARAAGAPAPKVQARVELRVRRTGRRVSLSWTGAGASTYRLAVAEDGHAARTLLAGATTEMSYSLLPGHVYVFTVAAVDGGGATLATSTPLRVKISRPVAVRAAAGRRPH
jgi:thermitase